MGDRALADVGDDFHLFMRMRREAGAGGDLVVIPDSQWAPAHALGVVVLGEREVVLGVQPAVVGAAELLEGSAFDHQSILVGRKALAGHLARFSRRMIA
ncbi:hypothetical protein D3C80_1791020 [compost metagenome]